MWAWESLAAAGELWPLLQAATLINKPSFKGLTIRISSIIPIKGIFFFEKGLHYASSRYS